MAVAVGLVLGALALLHVYWGVGGMSGLSVAVPEVDGRPVFTPSRLSCFAVAAALLLAAFLVLSRGGAVASPLPPAWTEVGAAGVGAVFVLRAIGDFHLVGFFKRVRGTAFARWDTRLFSPLSLAIGVASLWVALA